MKLEYLLVMRKHNMKFVFDSLFSNATNEQKWEQIKMWRNAELNLTDWTQLPDAPVNKSAWATYRQALRDLPTQGGLAEEVTIPARPGGN
jgi:Phage tail assembly chaperone protein